MVSYVYVIKNEVTGTIYVGKSNDPDVRWKNHIIVAKTSKTRAYNTHFARAIRKYGENSFVRIDLVQCVSEDEAFECEEIMCQMYVEEGFELYNMNGGGEGGYNPCDETIRRKKESHLGLQPTEETRAKISEANRHKRHRYVSDSRVEKSARQMQIAKEYGWNGPGYPPEFRAMVLADAAKYTDRLASQMHGVDNGTIVRWRKLVKE